MAWRNLLLPRKVLPRTGLKLILLIRSSWDRKEIKCWPSVDYPPSPHLPALLTHLCVCSTDPHYQIQCKQRCYLNTYEAPEVGSLSHLPSLWAPGFLGNTEPYLSVSFSTSNLVISAFCSTQRRRNFLLLSLSNIVNVNLLLKAEPSLCECVHKDWLLIDEQHWFIVL